MPAYLDSVADVIRPIMSHLFDLEEATIELELSPDDVDLWDSLNHLRLIAAVESEFEVRFLMSEIMRLSSFGEIVAAVRAKLR